MSTSDTSFGVLTLASPTDYLKAIGLALSVRASNPGVPIAVACSRKLNAFLEPHFDYVIEEHAGLRGFEHKVHLDEYTPFDTTFFFDSDVLVFKPLKPYVELWGNPVYSAVGWYTEGGISMFGLDRAAVLKKIGFERLCIIDGSGHACFRVPESKELFTLAREITANYKDYAGDIGYADEDVMSIAMTILGLTPSPYGDFFSRHLSGRPGTMEIDASRAHCRFIAADTGQPFEPCMMHFACNEAPISYTCELYRLFRASGVSTEGLISLGVHDSWNTHIKTPIHSRLGSVKRALAS